MLFLHKSLSPSQEKIIAITMKIEKSTILLSLTLRRHMITNMIRHMITNKPENYLKSGVIHIGISDHSLVYTCRKLSVPKSKHKVVVTRCLKNYNSHEFNEDLKYNE